MRTQATSGAARAGYARCIVACVERMRLRLRWSAGFHRRTAFLKRLGVQIRQRARLRKGVSEGARQHKKFARILFQRRSRGDQIAISVRRSGRSLGQRRKLGLLHFHPALVQMRVLCLLLSMVSKTSGFSTLTL